MTDWIVAVVRNDWLWTAIVFVMGAFVCRIVVARALRNPPDRLVRTNVEGRSVPAVLGWGVVAGIVAGLLVWAASMYIDERVRECAVGPGPSCLDFISVHYDSFLGLLVVTAGMFAVGLWDDLRGNERPRGFAGHLGELRRGRLTGGMVKLVGGTAAALLAALLLDDTDRPLLVVLTAVCIGLAANLVNLFDRAPGRALKVVLLAVVALVVLSGDPMVMLFAGLLGAAVVALPLDLSARAMLGDAGANPLGAMVGVGLTVDLWRSAGGLAFVAATLFALNLASEKWSFSEIIAKNPLLARLDHLGRE